MKYIGLRPQFLPRLVARLHYGDGTLPYPTIGVVYTAVNGDIQTATFLQGVMVGSHVIRSSRKKMEEGAKLEGTQDAYNRLGPELKEQIPSDWHYVLGDYLSPLP